MREDEYICEKLYLLSVIVGVALFMLVVGVNRCSHEKQPFVAKSDTVYVERIVKVKDSVPNTKSEKVIGHTSIPIHSKPLSNGKKPVKETGFSLHDTVDVERKGENLNMTLDLVQKEYSDDSTYVAYVSGLRYGAYPKLDSVIVSQKMMERTITNTIYREKKGLKVKLRPAVGGGYDPFNKGWGVYVGGAVILDW